MAGEDMPAELVAHLERTLEVDGRPGAPTPERGVRQRLSRCLHRKPVLALLDHRKADAGTGDGGANGDSGGVVGGAYGKRRIAARRDRAHLADIADDPREHGNKVELPSTAVTARQ